jgi:methionyl-tRNA formyltransferase
MAELGVPLLLSTTKDYLTGKITPQAQNEAEATFCKLITTADAQIDWSQPASEIKNKINAFYPWPATWTTISGKRLKIFPPITLTDDFAPETPGKIALLDIGLAVQCGQGAIIIAELQPEGKKLMRAKDYVNGLQAKEQLQLV